MVLPVLPNPKADGWLAKAENPPPDDGALPPKAEAPEPANALKAPLVEDPKAPEAGLIMLESGCDV